MTQLIDFERADGSRLIGMTRVSRPVADDERVGVPFVSLLTNKSGETVRKWRREGITPEAVKVGRDWTWKKSVILDWVAAGCPRPASGV